MNATLEERVIALEAQVTRLLAEQKTNKAKIPWWQQRYGAFQNDPLYDEAMQLGAEYRRSQPTAAEEIKTLEEAGIHVPLPSRQ